MADTDKFIQQAMNDGAEKLTPEQERLAKIEDQENAQILRQALEDDGHNVTEVLADYHNFNRVEHPDQATGMEDIYVPNEFGNNQSWTEDFLEGAYEGFVVNTVEGFGNLIPTAAQAFGGERSKDDWTNKWIGAVSGFADKISPTYSDEYYESGMWSSRGMAQGLGQGVGFVGGIILGGGSLAKIGTKIGAGAKTSQRVGSFIMGTNMMYPMVYDEARKNNIEEAHAARLALGIAGIVSMTEGFALEWIGKSMSKPITSKITKKMIQQEVKELGAIKSINDVYAAEQKILTGLSKKMRGLKKPMIEGSAIETGQEFSQTYIEEGLKQTYDLLYAKEGATEGKGKFGADIGYGPGSSESDEARWETFSEAAFGGLIGGIIGGGMPLGGIGKVQHQEELFTYINDNVNKGKKKNIIKLQSLNESVNQLEANKDITPEHATTARKHLKSMVEIANINKKLGLKDNIAGYQLFQLTDMGNGIIGEINNKFKHDDALPEPIAKEFEGRRKLANEIIKSINEDILTIATTKRSLTKDKETFEKKLIKYSELGKEVYDNNITEEKFIEKLNKIKGVKPVAEEKAESKFKVAEGIELTERAITDMDSIVSQITEAKKESDEKAQSVAQQLALEYGVDIKAIEHMMENPDVAEKFAKGEYEELELVDLTFDDQGNPEPTYASKKEQKIESQAKYISELEEGGAISFASKEDAEFFKENKEAISKRVKELKKAKTKGVADTPSPTVEWDVEKKYGTLTDEQLNKKKYSIEDQIKELGETPDVFKLERLQSELKGVQSEIDLREDAEVQEIAEEFKKGKRANEKETEKERQERLSKKSKSRRRRVAREEKAPTKKKRSKELKVVDENTVEYNKEEYQIVTDEKGNIVALQGKNKTITKESVLVEAEIKRNRVGLDADVRTEAELKEAVGQAFEVPGEFVEQIDGILDMNLTDEIADVLNEGLPSDVSAELLQKLDYYIDNALDLLSELKDSEYAEAIYDGLLELKTQIDEQYENEYRSEEEIQDELEEESIEEEVQEEVEDIRTEEQKEVDDLIDSRKEKFGVEEDNAFFEYPTEINDVIDLATAEESLDVEGIDSAVDFLHNQYKEVMALLKGKDRAARGIKTDKLLAEKAKLENLLNFLDDYSSSLKSETPLPSFSDYKAVASQPEVEIAPAVSPESAIEVTQLSLFDINDFEDVNGPVESFEDYGKRVSKEETDDTKPQEQRVGLSVNAQESISSNPELYQKIKEHFRKIFPNIPVEEVDRIVSEHGAAVLARVVEKGIEIDTSKALQNSIIHEYAHIYLKVLGKNHPIVKAGLELIEDTQYYDNALDAYGKYNKKGELINKAEVLEEALVEAIADSAYDSLKVKLEGSKFDKFMAFLKKFWKNVKGFISKDKGRDVVDIIADGMTFRNASIPVDVGFLQGMNKNQLENPKMSEMLTVAQASMTLARIKKAANPESKANPRNPNSLRTASYKALAQRYLAEKNGTAPDSSLNIFEGYDLEIDENLISDPNALAQTMYSEMKEKMPNFFNLTEKAVETIAKRPLPKIFKEDESSSAVKSDQRITESVRSIVTAIVDNSGNLVSPDRVYRYIASTAKNTWGTKGFVEQMEKDIKDSSNVEAKRLYATIMSMPDGIRQSVLTELSSLIQIQYQRIVMHEKDGAISLINQIVNKDYETDEIVKEKLQRFEVIQDGNNAFNSINVSLKKFNNKYNKRLFLENNQDPNSESYQVMEKLRGVMEEIYQETIPRKEFDEFVDIITKKNSAKPTKWGVANFVDALIAVMYKEELKYTKADGTVVNKIATPKHVSNYSLNLMKVLSGNQFLENNFTNTGGNNVSSTRFGYWISELNSLIFNKPSHMARMKKSRLYKNNPVFKQFEREGNVEWFVHDAIRNAYQDSVVELSKQSLSDTEMSGLVYFATVSSKDHYFQNFGVTGDRGHSTYFKVPRYANMEEIQKELKNQAELEQKMFDEKAKGLNKEEYNKLVNKFNKMSINKIVDGKVVTPTDADIKSKVDKLLVKAYNNGLKDALSKDLVGPDKIYKSMKEMVQAYYLSDAINRNALMNIYEGPMLDRKHVADVVKRGSGINSGGKLIEVDKPVWIFVVEANSAVSEGTKTSDSFSFNGSHFYSHISKQSGDLDKVGLNMKDMSFQSNPDNGKMAFMKMSSINVTEDGLKGMSDPNSTGNGYAEIGESILALEKHLAEKYGDAAPYVKVVDKDVMKGNEGKYTAININDFVNNTKEGSFDNVMKSGFQHEFDSYRIAFNMNKDLTKIPLNEQLVILSTQLGKIALSGATIQEVQEFENSIVSLLQDGLGIEGGDYSKGGVYKNLKDVEKLINLLTKEEDEQQANTPTQILQMVKEHNSTATSQERITAFDHPNLISTVEQLISSKLTKAGVRTDIPGAYLHMIPNFGNDLKWYDDNNGIPEIAVPWSMFAKTKEEAEALLASSKDGLKTVVVRVPASLGMSTFVANVKYFTDGKANTVIVPDQFIKASDADHDGDKTFVYRQEIDKDGKILENSKKTKVFNRLFNRISSPKLVEQTKLSLELDELEALLKKYGFNQVDGYALSDYADVANISNQMSFGGDAIGILAIASKMLSVLSQSKEVLENPISFGYDLTVEEKDNKKTVTGKLVEGKEYAEFNDDSAELVAQLLQAALDMGNNPMLPSTGINQHTISVGTTLALLGVNETEIMGFLNDPAILKLVAKLDDNQGNFKIESPKTTSEIVDDYVKGVDAQVLYNDKIINSRLQADGIITTQGKIKPGTYKTVEGAYYKLSETDVEGKLKIELVDLVDDQQLAMMNKYLEIQDIANDIGKLIPIIKLDNELPNNGEKLEALNKSVEDVTAKEEDSKMSFSTENLMNRPLIKHYMEVIKNLRNVYRSKMITEHSTVHALTKRLSKSSGRSNIKKDVDNSIVHQFAQENIVGKYENVADFIYGFGDDIKSLLVGINTDEIILPDEFKKYQSAIEDMADFKENSTTDEYEKALDVYAANKDTIAEGVEVYNKLSDDAINLRDLAENAFLSYLTYKTDEVTDKTLVSPKKNFRNSTGTVKQTVREDFRKLPAEMQEKFIDYQLYRFGVDDKFGSMMDMLPQDMHITVLKQISKINNTSKATYLEENMPSIELNTMLSLMSKMENDTKAQPHGETTIISKKKRGYIKYDNELYKKTEETTSIKGNEYTIYEQVTGKNFIGGKDFVKFGKLPKADPNKITESVPGAPKLEVDKDGEKFVVITTDEGVEIRIPYEDASQEMKDSLNEDGKSLNNKC